MNNLELKKEFEFCCSALVKYEFNNKWDFYWDVLDVNENTRDFFKPKFEKFLEMLNENDSEIINMETDDIFNMLILDNCDFLKNKQEVCNVL